ncbi:MAG: 4Fe-4S binding protein [Candidatus Omnitrophica bacterium]|nr:4Fe-4S binding protein [Candidatus Omnitrophota bacterium]
MGKIVEVNLDNCIGCGVCAEICPKKILVIENDKCKVTNENLCGKSGCCQKVCPVGAIKVTK